MIEQEPLEIQIKSSNFNELDLLEKEFSPGNDYQKKRHTVQESGQGVYLIAWHDNNPIGHFLLRWNGPEKDTSNRYPFGVPYLEAGGTKKAYRRKGVATKLVKEAERLVRERGISKIGLAVGSETNPTAKRLYEKLGYQDWGKGEFEVSWEFVDKEGKKGTDSEICIYMFKNL